LHQQRSDPLGLRPSGSSALVSKEATRCPQDSGSSALASKEATRCPQDSGSSALASK